MDGTRAVGSELIKDPDQKLARIIEMAGIKKVDNSKKINENSIRTRKIDETVLHTATASNGTIYGIVQEGKHVYIKEAKNGLFEYIGGIQNIREHSYKTYADALKHLNFLFKDINMITETKIGTNILGEGYKLKVGNPAPAPEPDFGNDTPAPDGSEDFNFGDNAEPDGGEDFNFDNEEPAAEPGVPNGNNEEETPEKKIQKLAGKLAQEIRDAQEGDVDDKLAKSVTNTILSATMGFLTDEDKTEISNKLEDEEGGEGFDTNEFPDAEPSEEPAEEPNTGEEDLTLESLIGDMEEERLGMAHPIKHSAGGSVEEEHLGISKALASSMTARQVEESDMEEHNEPYDPSPMSKPGNHEVNLNEVDVEEHNEPYDPSPMSKPGNHEVHEAVAEEDPYALYEAALSAIMGKAGKMGGIKEMKHYMNETWKKMEEAYNNQKYSSMGRLAETLFDEHDIEFDPSPMSKPGDHEVHLNEVDMEEHNEKYDPSPMSKPGDHEVNESDAVCEKCGKKVCECGKSMGEHNEPYDPSPMSKPGNHEVSEEKVHHKREAGQPLEEAEKKQIDEAVNFLRNKISDIKNRLND